MATAPGEPQEVEAVRVPREFWRRMTSSVFGQLEFRPERFAAAPNRAHLVEPIE